MDCVKRNPVSADGEIAKKLFSSSPERPRQGKRSPGKADPNEPLNHDILDYKYGDFQGAKKKPRMGFGGAIIFFMLCVVAVFLTLQFNSMDWNNLTLKDVSKFFSNEVLHRQTEATSGIFYFNGKHFLGVGALQVALLLGVICAMFTCVFTFYDSNIPGNFPPTPVSPRRQDGIRTNPSSSRWHLGYIFVLINFFVAFSLSLFYMRWNMGLPLL